MTAVPILLGHRTAARTRAALDAAAIGLPVLLAVAAVGWRLFGLAGIVGATMIGLAVLAGLILQRDRRFDLGWLIGQLDARVPRFEDSTALLFREPAALTGLAALQRARLEARLTEAHAVDLRPGWSLRPIAVVWAASAVIVALALLWPAASRPAETASAETRAATPASPPLITGTRLRITPPAYTGLPAREQTALDARVPEGSRIEWIIGFAPQPASAALDVPEGRPVALVRDGAQWTGAAVIDASRLYRIEADGLARQRLNRIDAVADAPPVVRLVEPESQLVTVTPGQTTFTPVFEAGDDYGVLSSAELRITVTKGDGENITFDRRSRSISGAGDARRLRFSVPLNMAAEGMEPGSDMIVQLVVSDNRAPQRQRVEGPSVILRWPTDLEMADGLDGMAMRVMPAYFASQRQIIIDAEALVAERPRLEPREVMNRSNGLGEDQAQLRLRYGQFMGEEAEGGGGGGIVLPTNDAPALPASDTPAEEAEDHEEPGHDDDDEHEGEEGEGGPARFGEETDVLHEFGHAHDTAEAATLFAPRTRSALARALDAMWSSERELRQGRPETALPHAYEALELLKEAQRATRIFLRRVGSDLPPVDFSRRLSGEREDIVADNPEPPERDPADAVLADAWRALDERPGAQASPLQLGVLERWVRSNAGRLPDALALTAAIDTVRNEPNCLSCRRTLRGLLWTALERPPVAVRRREAPGTSGQRYLDALR